MRLIALLLALFSVLAAPAGPARPRTLRVEYVHSGVSGDERFAIRALAREGEWPGPMAVEDTSLGKYRVEVKDAASARVLFARGFASIYGEWETTGEAKDTSRAFEESVRFPEPAGPVRVAISKRTEAGAFKELWSIAVDPKDPAIDDSRPPAGVKVWAVQESGAPADKVDLLLIGDGYPAAQMDKWHADARRLTEVFFAAEPFKSRRRDFNVWAIDVAADESGISRPSDGIYRRNPLRATYDAFGSERYVLTFDDRRLREVAAAAPYDFLEIVANDRKYGGGGIHNLYATVSADNEFTPYVFVHEFAHHFAGLADEYYTSASVYEAQSGRPEPWEPNVTADPKGTRWRDLITPGTETPTPWPKAEFEAMQKDTQARRRAIRAAHRPEAEMEALFREERGKDTALLGPYHGKVGAFEGAMYEASGYYRPQADCIMFSRDEVGFCAVCRRALSRVIDEYSSR